MTSRPFCGVCTGFPNYLMTKRVWLTGYSALPLFTAKNSTTIDTMYVANFNVRNREAHTCLTYKDLMDTNASKFPANKLILPGFYVSPVVLQDDKAIQYRTDYTEWKSLIRMYLEMLQASDKSSFPVTVLDSTTESWLLQFEREVRSNLRKYV